MKKLVLVPDGWPCSLEECPPGLFLSENKNIGLKSEYRPNGKVEAFCDSGEYFCGEGQVQPLRYYWEDGEDENED